MWLEQKHRHTEVNKLWIEVLAIEVEDVSWGQASSSEATGDLTGFDDVGMR